MDEEVRRRLPTRRSAPATRGVAALIKPRVGHPSQHRAPSSSRSCRAAEQGESAVERRYPRRRCAVLQARCVRRADRVWLAMYEDLTGCDCTRCSRRRFTGQYTIVARSICAACAMSPPEAGLPGGRETPAGYQAAGSTWSPLSCFLPGCGQKVSSVVCSLRWSRGGGARPAFEAWDNSRQTTILGMSEGEGLERSGGVPPQCVRYGCRRVASLECDQRS